MNKKRICLTRTSNYLFLISILFLWPLDAKSYHCSLVDGLVDHYVVEVKQEFGLEMLGYGGAMMNEVKWIGLDFTSNEHANIHDARTLLVELVQKFLASVNSEEALTPYLAEHPFTSTHLQFGLGFNKSDRGCEGDIAYVYLYHGEIDYNIVGSEGRYEVVYKESYADALQKVEGQQ